MSLFLAHNVMPFLDCYKHQLTALVARKIKDLELFSDMLLNRNMLYNLRVVALVGPICRAKYGMQSINNKIISLCNKHPEIIGYPKETANMSQFRKKFIHVLKNINNLNSISTTKRCLIPCVLN